MHFRILAIYTGKAHENLCRIHIMIDFIYIKLIVHFGGKIDLKLYMKLTFIHMFSRYSFEHYHIS